MGIESKQNSNSGQSEGQGISRRGVFALGIGAAGAIAAAPKLRDALLEVTDKSDLEAQAIEGAKRIKDLYGITVLFEDPFWEKDGFSSNESLAAEKVRVLGYLESELATYPSSLLSLYTRIGFKEITIRADLLKKQEGMIDEGAVEDAEEHGLPIKKMLLSTNSPLSVYDLKHGLGWGEKAMFMEIFSHELFHVMDDFDHEWENEYPPHKYESDFNANHVLGRMTNEEIPGYAMVYGVTNQQEDRATIYQQLATGNPRLIERCSSDPVLALKVTRIKQYLSRMSETLMDEEYWAVRNKPGFDRYAPTYFHDKAKRIAGESFADFKRSHPNDPMIKDEEDFKGLQEYMRQHYS